MSKWQFKIGLCFLLLMSITGCMTNESEAEENEPTVEKQSDTVIENNDQTIFTNDDPDSKIIKWVAENITDSMSEKEKVEKAIAYCQSFPYNYAINSYQEMLEKGSGECWANASLMIHLCNAMGITAGYRTRSNTLSYPDFHLDNYVIIDGECYVVDCGHEDRQQIEFYPASGYTYLFQSDGTIMITDYDGYCVNLSIPSMIDGYTVSKISSYAFEYHFEMQSVTIPDSVTVIDSLAFRQCPSLRTITVSKDTQIDDLAFYCETETILGNTKLDLKDGIIHKTYLYY